MQFATYLKRVGIRNKTINTPGEISQACGISVMFWDKDLASARFVLSKSMLASFKGFFLVIGDGVFKKYKAI